MHSPDWSKSKLQPAILLTIDDGMRVLKKDNRPTNYSTGPNPPSFEECGLFSLPQSPLMFQSVQTIEEATIIKKITKLLQNILKISWDEYEDKNEKANKRTNERRGSEDQETKKGENNRKSKDITTWRKLHHSLNIYAMRS